MSLFQLLKILKTKYKLPADSAEKSNFLTQLKSFLPFPLDKVALSYDIEKLTQALPSIMANFRSRVSKELTENPELDLRLPSKYKEAMKNIH